MWKLYGATSREEKCWRKFSLRFFLYPAVDNIPGEIIFYRDLHVSHARG
jgi:hypothetical protein